MPRLTKNNTTQIQLKTFSFFIAIKTKGKYQKIAMVTEKKKNFHSDKNGEKFSVKKKKQQAKIFFIPYFSDEKRINFENFSLCQT
jgi:hypothetical protein